MDNWFTSTGLLRMAVLEVVDIVHPSNRGGAKKRTVSRPTCLVHCRIAIRDEAGNELRSHDTALQPCYSSDSLKIGEEFIFNQVLSSSVLCLSFRYIDMQDQRNFVIGQVAIPIARLEENIKVGARNSSGKAKWKKGEKSLQGASGVLQVVADVACLLAGLLACLNHSFID
jgi:hypothetical protein